MKAPLSAIAINNMRQQSIDLRNEGRYEQSWSEAIDANGVARRFDKEGVFACEPDGGDYHTSPDLLTYMTSIITHLPLLLNSSSPSPYAISNTAFNAKLAVTSAGGSVYPKHVDNPPGQSGGALDSRRLTVILYLNPTYSPKDGGELRLHLPSSSIVDIPPTTNMVFFWSDLVPHEVLPTKPNQKTNDANDRYALTIWLPTEDVTTLHDRESPFYGLPV